MEGRLTKEEYISTVTAILESMIEQSKTDPTYCFVQDLDNYYTEKIQKDDILTLDEFTLLYKSLLEKSKGKHTAD